MHDRFHLNALVKLSSDEEDRFNFCEVGAEVDANFIIDLKELYSKILTYCVSTLGTVKLSIVSIKLMPSNKQIKITANVLLAEDEGKVVEKEEDKYRKVEFTKGDNLGIYRLFKYMELRAMEQKSADFHSLVHVRVIPVGKDDLPATKF